MRTRRAKRGKRTKTRHIVQRRSYRTVHPSGCCIYCEYTAERRLSIASACHAGGRPTAALAPAIAKWVVFWVVVVARRSINAHLLVAVPPSRHQQVYN